MKTHIGRRIKMRLNELNKSQKALSEAASIPQSTLSDIIKEKKEPGISKVKRIAEFLGVDLHWLITGARYSPLPAAGHSGVQEPAKPYPESITDQDPLRSEINLRLEGLSKKKQRLVLEMIRQLGEDA